MRFAFSNISKLYVANFLTGLVFWYGIEKLFMQSIGVADDIGVILASYLALTLILEVPTGMLADRWSRKGMLVISMLCLAASAIVCGTSHSTGQYIIGYLLYGCYLVTTSGTYQALIYDVLHEEGRQASYSKIMGRAYALFLCGAGVANIASGFLAEISLTLPFWLSVVPALMNVWVLLSIKEPTFHKKEQKEKIFIQMHSASKAILKIALLRSLVFISMVLTASELFKQDFSQFYMLAFNQSAALLGLFWAAYAFVWALGSFIAHRFAAHLHWLLVISLGSFVVLSIWRSPWALTLFLVQALAASAAHNLIETHVQDATPSHVRASILSVIAMLDSVLALPLSLLFGWLIATYDIFAAITFVGAVSLGGLAYWLLLGNRRLKKQRATMQTGSYAQI